MEVIFFITLILYVFVVGSCTNFVDYDFFARLIVGKTFFQTGEILKYDFLSYSKTHPWYDHEWGASLVFYFIQDNFGDIGLQVFKAFCIALTFLFLILIIKLRRKVLYKNQEFPIFNFFFFFLMLQPVSKLIYSLRCHHFTFMFFAIWLYILEKARLEKNYKILWTLPLFMVVWSNVHGGCFMGLGITGIYIVGEFLAKEKYLPFVYTLLSSFLSMFINPYGKEYVIFLLKATTMQRPNIVEWQAPFSKYFIFKFIKYKVILLGFLGLLAYRFKKTLNSIDEINFVNKVKKIWNNIDKTKFMLIFVTCLLTLKSMRFITYFIFVLIPFCYDDFYFIFSKRMKPKWNYIKEMLIFWGMLVIFLLNVVGGDIKYNNKHDIFPLSEIEYLVENNVKGNVFVPFEIGSYAAYKLYPNNFILQDGRYEEVYNLELNDDYVKTIVLGAMGWKNKLKEIHHDSIIVYKNTPIYELLKDEVPDYYLIMESDTFALFIRKEVYKKIKKPIMVPPDKSEFYQKVLWRNNINWLK